jgi:hypothetical protein
MSKIAEQLGLVGIGNVNQKTIRLEFTNAKARNAVANSLRTITRQEVTTSNSGKKLFIVDTTAVLSQVNIALSSAAEYLANEK